MVSGIRDDEKIPTERIEEMHEVVNDVFGDLVESGFDNNGGFVVVGMSYEYFTYRSIFERGFEVVLANLGGHFIINVFEL